MNNEYYKIVTEAAIEKLKAYGKPMSEAEFTRSLVALLKKKHGKDDKRHSSKVRFRKETFKYVIETKEWKDNITPINEGKYSLTSWLKDLPDNQVDSDWDWKNIGMAEAKFRTLNLLKKLDPFKFEELVRVLIEALYDGFKAETTRKTGDMGIDVKAFKESNVHKGKRQAFFAQAKCFKGVVGRENADKFVGAVKEFHNSENWEVFYALFVTTGKLQDSFRQKLVNSEEKGVNFICWDGDELTDKLFQLGWGLSYSINTDFWNDLDSKLIPKEIDNEKITVHNKR